MQTREEFERGEVGWNREMSTGIDPGRSLEWGRRIADRLGWARGAENPRAVA